MAAHACGGGGVAGAAPSAAMTRLKSRRPSSTRSTLMKAMMKRRKAAAGGGGGKRATSRKQRVMVIRRKMEVLRRLVPAACGSGDGERGVDDGRRLEELLLHAAGYIMSLQMLVRVMQVMVHALNHPEDY